MDRREFLRLTGGAAAIAAVGTGCGSGSDRSEGTGAATTSGPGGGKRTLRIAQLSHYVRDYNTWFDNEFCRRWGEDHDVEVVVDHIPYAELPARAGAEVAAGRGHDLFAFITPPASFEDDVIDHREIVEEVQGKVGGMAPIVERNIRNPKTGKYFGFGQYWAANPVHYRVDLWNEIRPGLVPHTWEDVLRAAPQLKTLGHQVGIGFSADDDSCFSLFGLMAAFGSRLQDEEARPVLDTPATVEAVKLGASLFRAGMSDEVFHWDSSSNNRLLATGQGSMVINAISAIRDAEEEDPGRAANISLGPALAGPAGRLGVNSVVQVFVVWRFANNQEAAKQFLVDLALAGRDDFLQSRFYNLPAFPKSVPDLAQLLARDDRARPVDKYALLAGAEDWSTNVGHPGHDNAATDEIFFAFIIPKMFAAAARGELTAEDAVKRAHAEAVPIFDKWRERGKI
jgi:multiple sugar transport system substrate-binding protein